jgi:hypothetical protein
MDYIIPFTRVREGQCVQHGTLRVVCVRANVRVHGTWVSILQHSSVIPYAGPIMCGASRVAENRTYGNAERFRAKDQGKGC